MIHIDLKSNKPLYEQIIQEIKEDVVKGYLKSGDELPSVRKMAMELSVTPNTVAKAYQELERNHIIETIRGKGTYISADIDLKRVDEDKLEKIEKELNIQLLEMVYMGMSKEEIKKFIDKCYDNLVKENREND